MILLYISPSYFVLRSSCRQRYCRNRSCYWNRRSNWTEKISCIRLKTVRSNCKYCSSVLSFPKSWETFGLPMSFFVSAGRKWCLFFPAAHHILCDNERIPQKQWVNQWNLLASIPWYRKHALTMVSERAEITNMEFICPVSLVPDILRRRYLR